MRYFWSFFWALLISLVISFILVSMAGNAFAIADTLAMAVILTLATYILGEGILKSEK
ncbi:DUF2929 family protein [Lentibacillus sp. CBA3610]|nr:DUF2929 family protein [Lentibacillus sp. CBA3610]QKY68598.1 DUF2929 family protein [Lentibacillus sp. CBA3610]